MANNVYLQILVIIGKGDEAIAWMNSWINRGEKDISKREYPGSYTSLYLWAGYFKEALEVQEKIMNSLHDSTAYAIYRLAAAYAMNDMNSEALAQMEKIKDHSALKEDANMQVNYAWSLGRCGRREEALEKLEDIRAYLIKNNIDPAYFLACVYAGLGDKDKALEYLNQAYEKHSTLMVNLISDWWLRSLHGDPRFEDLRKKVGFPDVPTARKR